jgi:uncharacterized membrane protein YeaQ/YmgE (transglycosylase-associated protein family)
LRLYRDECIIEVQTKLRKGDVMDGLGIIGWIILGGLAGWVASMIAGTNARQGLLGNILTGIVGGVLGGLLFGLLGGSGVTGFNLWSFLVAVVGAVILLLLWRAVRGGAVRE